MSRSCVAVSLPNGVDMVRLPGDVPTLPCHVAHTHRSSGWSALAVSSRVAHAVGSPHHGHVDLGLLPGWRQWCSCIITESTGSCTSSTCGTWMLPGSRMPNVELEMDLADLYMAIGVWLTLE